MRVEVKAQNNRELLDKLQKSLNSDVTEVYVSLRPTKEILVRILEWAPNVKRISCPPSLYPKVSKKVIRALAQIGVELVPEGYPRGRPRKYDENTVRKVREMASSGVPMKEISSRLNIPLRTVYYMVKREEASSGTRK